jgi:cysteine-rich repeat protein
MERWLTHSVRVLAAVCLAGCGDDAARIDAGSSDASSADGGATSDAGSACGDGAIGGAEQCDDGDVDSGDGCSGACLVERGFECEGEPSVCTSVCLADAECDDGAFCNGVETCAGGACAPGTPPSLDDAIPCTTDRCDEDADVVLHVPDDAACDDGDACNGAERCSATGCGDGIPVAIDDGIACTVDACDPVTGLVTHGADASRCDDRDACTTDECVLGVGCTATFACECRSDADCDDGNPCTDDACGAGGACVNTNHTRSCDDGRYCNGADRCSAGACVHAGDPCAAGGECANVCNESAGSCTLPAGTTCRDDGNPCTDDRCDGAGTCAHPDNTATCDDANACTTGDRCGGGACAGAAIMCTTPPAPACVDPMTLRRYASTGMCTTGACSYPHTDVACPCAAGACTCSAIAWETELVEAPGWPGDSARSCSIRAARCT